MERALFLIPVAVAGLFVGIVGIVIRFKHPELTESQLFLRFWKMWTTMIVILLAALVLSIIMIV